MHISGNTILITGGGSGIGLALVRELYYEGNNLILTGRNEKTLHAVKKEFPNISTFQCDIFNPEDVDNLLDTCRKAFKTINIFIANAGIQRMYSQQQNNLKTRNFQDDGCARNHRSAPKSARSTLSGEPDQNRYVQ